MVLKKLFTEKGQLRCFNDTNLQQAAKATLLPTFEVKTFLDNNLKTVLNDRKRGAEKAAAIHYTKNTHPHLPRHPPNLLSLSCLRKSTQ